MELNNRETASLIWIAAFLGYAFLNDKEGHKAEAFKGLLRAFFAPKIIVVLVWASLWIILCVQALSYVGVWEISNLKTTLLWAITFAFVTLLDTNRISEDDTYFRKTIRDTIGATVVVTFIAEAYSFSFIAEIILTPLLALMAVIQILSEKNSEQASVNKLVSNILATMGLAYIGYGMYMVVTDFGEFASWNILREFFIPIVLSLLFLPYLFVIAVLVSYELTFLGFRWALPDDALQRYAKFQAIVRFRFDLNGLRRWKRHIGVSRPSSREEIHKSIAEIKASQKRERNPPPVSPERGWCPIAATKFLEDQALAAGDYHRSDDGQWRASSSMRPLDKTAIQPDNIAYYIEGDEGTAKQLKVVLNVNDHANARISDLEFHVICIDLLERAFKEVSQTLKDEVLRGDTIDINLRDSRVRTQKEDFANPAKGYSRRLIIDHGLNSKETPEG